jgi:small subunit ribosomal protein S16
MAVKIRFTRIGKKHAPVYRIVATDSRRKRDGKCLENLGTYNPMTKEIVQFHADRIAYWISVGAVVTDSVQRLLDIKHKQGSFVKPVQKQTVAPKEKAVVEKKPKAVKKAPVAKVEKPAAKKPAADKKTAKPKTASKK